MSVILMFILWKSGHSTNKKIGDDSFSRTIIYMEESETLCLYS